MEDLVFKLRGDFGGVESLNFDFRAAFFHSSGDGGGLRALYTLETALGFGSPDLDFDFDLLFDLCNFSEDLVRKGLPELLELFL